jgi:hypothetical protein
MGAARSSLHAEATRSPAGLDQFFTGVDGADHLFDIGFRRVQVVGVCVVPWYTWQLLSRKAR